MTKKLELYRCSVCGNLVEVLVEGVGELSCCGEPMKHITPQNEFSDETLSKMHIPHIQTKDGTTKVFVEEHPMVNSHYVMFLQAISNDEDEVCTKFLYSGSEPVMRLGENKRVKARSYCNIHGLYLSEENCRCGKCD